MHIGEVGRFALALGASGCCFLPRYDRWSSYKPGFSHATVLASARGPGALSALLCFVINTSFFGNFLQYQIITLVFGALPPFWKS